VSSPRPGNRAVLILLYVVPVAAAVVLLTLADLGILAAALVCVEAVVALAVWAVRRVPAPSGPPPPSRRPWLVPAVMVGTLGLMVLVAVVAARAG
jgi:hypothetical protein